MTGQQGYVFDNIGNRISAQSGSLGNMSTVRYTANDLNQYTGVVTPGFKDILGLAIARLHASRLATVSDGNGDSAAYSYLANSPLAGQITFSRNGATRMTTTKQYDYLNRLSSISSSPSNSFTYQYNAANQRTLATALRMGVIGAMGMTRWARWIPATSIGATMTPVAGQQFDYAFDTIGNRTQTQAGGDQNGGQSAGGQLHQQHGQPDHQPGRAGVCGRHGGCAGDQHGERERAGGVSEGGVFPGAVAGGQQCGGGRGTSVTVLPPAREQRDRASSMWRRRRRTTAYDNDGNLSSDGRWSYTWDAENRLITMTSLNGAPSGSQLQLAFAYDYQGRRIQKSGFDVNNRIMVAAYTDNYAYDGWNCIGDS